MRHKSLLPVVGLLVASCGLGDDLGDMTASEAEQICLDRADRFLSKADVNITVTHKEDRYWDVLFGVDPPRNLVWCTIDATDGYLIRFGEGTTPRPARRALRGGWWPNN